MGEREKRERGNDCERACVKQNASPSKMYVSSLKLCICALKFALICPVGVCVLLCVCVCLPLQSDPELIL